MTHPSGSSHKHQTQALDQNRHRIALQCDCPETSMMMRETILPAGSKVHVFKETMCRQLRPLQDEAVGDYWADGEPVGEALYAALHELTICVAELTGTHDYATAGFCKHPRLPERICICRTWMVDADA